MIGLLGGFAAVNLQGANGLHPLDRQSERASTGHPRHAMQLLALLRDAPADGLSHSRYPLEQIERGLSKPSDAAALAQANRFLANAITAYARDLRVPQTATNTMYIDAELAPRAIDAGVLLNAAQPAHLMQTFQNSNPLYRDLKTGLERYRMRWSGLPQTRIPEGTPLAIGATGKRVAALRQRLGLAAAPAAYDANLAKAVSEFRIAHGLGRSSVADTATVHALNLGAAHFERLIALNLDRLRGLPVDGRPYIVVDAAGARLHMIDGGKQVDEMRAVVGRPEMQTPELAGLIRFAVFNPYWNIPPDLVRNVVAPRVLEEGAPYLAEHRYALFTDWRASTPDIDADAVDWRKISSGSDKVWVRQLPGGDNMMGEVKFMLPNRLGIYLHDTPHKEDFGRGARWLSSGCVRVEDARRLARWIFGTYPLAKGDATPEKRIDVPQPVAVFITYLTAVPEGDQVRFQKDVYGRDGALLARMPRI